VDAGQPRPGVVEEDGLRPLVQPVQVEHFQLRVEECGRDVGSVDRRLDGGVAVLGPVGPLQLLRAAGGGGVLRPARQLLVPGGGERTERGGLGVVVEGAPDGGGQDVLEERLPDGGLDVGELVALGPGDPALGQQQAGHAGPVGATLLHGRHQALPVRQLRLRRPEGLRRRLLVQGRRRLTLLHHPSLPPLCHLDEPGVGWFIIAQNIFSHSGRCS
jgi:hypothetical protein